MLRFETGLGRLLPQMIWKALVDDEKNKTAINIFEEIIYQKMMKLKNASKNEDLVALQKKTLLEIKADFSTIENVRVFFSTTPFLKLVILLFLFATLSGAVVLWETYGELLYTKVAVSLGSVATSIGALYKLCQKGTDYVTNCADKFSDQIKTAQGIVGDVESTYVLNECNQQIQTEKKKIDEIKRRLTIIEGESMESVVKDRVDSGVYLDKLGIVHRAKEDLDRLHAAMNNKYYREQHGTPEEKDVPIAPTNDAKGCLGRIKSCMSTLGNGNDPSPAEPQEVEPVNVEEDSTVMFPRGKPRIVLFVDDLDRCEPDKVVEVLEAMQLLVKTDLFVVVAAIDLRYVCLSLEHKVKYKDILNEHKSPTGMDFLEKIIQIPYRLPSISDEAINDYIDSQNEAREVDEQQSPKSPSTSPIPADRQPFGLFNSAFTDPRPSDLSDSPAIDSRPSESNTEDLKEGVIDPQLPSDSSDSPAIDS